MTSVSSPLLSQIWLQTFKQIIELSLMWVAWLRCLSIYFFYVWMICFWLWWPMTVMWPSVTHCIIQSLWTPSPAVS
jgi:hypothetical protein